MTLVGLLGCLRAWWTVVLAALLVGLGGAGLAASQADRTYEATTVILLRPASVPTDGADEAHARYAAVRANHYHVLVRRAEVLAEASHNLGPDVTPDQIRARVSAENPLDSPLILVRARSTDPNEAARTSTVVAEALSSAVERAESSGPGLSRQVEAPIAVAAVPPPHPRTPRVSLYLAVGLLAGAALGVCCALALSVWRFGRVEHAPSRHVLVTGTVQPARPVKDSTRWFTGAHVVWALMVAASIPWRAGVYYEGGVDLVVLGKAGLAVAALVIASLLARNSSQHYPIAAAPVLLLCAYLAVTMVGGLANGDLASAAVVAARVAILAGAVCLLVGSYGATQAMRALVHVLTVVALCGALTGLFSYSGRLAGGIPALHPNALATMTALVGVWVLAKVFTGRDTVGDVLLVAACVLIILLTGSRTSLAAFSLTVVVMLFRVNRMRRGTFLVFVLAAPPVVYLLMGTELIESIALRGGSEQVMMLSNRLIAWEATFEMVRDGWQTWFGQGLAHKHVPVAGQWWDTQLLDSSWISAWVQSGILGIVLVGVLAVATIVRAALRPRADGPTWLGIAVLVSTIGFLESGLFDASVPFLAFFLTALAVGLPGKVSAPVRPEAMVAALSGTR